MRRNPAVYLSCAGVTSEASNFYITVLFVNQCLLIMDAITPRIPPPPLPSLIITHYSFLCFPKQSINITGFLGIT